MTQHTIETQVKLGSLVDAMKNTAARIDKSRAKIARMEQHYHELCKGFPRGKEPLEPVELIQERLEVANLVKQWDDLGKQVNALEDKALDNLTAKIVSRGKSGVMVVLKGKDEITGKQVSITRHLRNNGKDKYTGKSIFGHRTVEYFLQSAEEAQAA